MALLFLTFSSLYHRKCQRRGVGGQKMPKSCQRTKNTLLNPCIDLYGSLCMLHAVHSLSLVQPRTASKINAFHLLRYKSLKVVTE